MRSVLRGQERSGQKQYFFYPSAGSAQQQAAERYGQFGEETNTDKKHRLNQNKIDRLIKKYLNQY